MIIQKNFQYKTNAWTSIELDKLLWLLSMAIPKMDTKWF